MAEIQCIMWFSSKKYKGSVDGKSDCVKYAVPLNRDCLGGIVLMM